MNTDIRWLTWVEKQFVEIAGEDRKIDFEEFRSAMNAKDSFFAERCFTLFDRDGSGNIDLEELMQGLTLLIKGAEEDKLKFLFDIYDVDGNGSIDIDELKTVLRSCMEESCLKLTEEDLDTLTITLFESADDDNSGKITFEELQQELKKHPGILENLTLSGANWLKPPITEKGQSKPKLPRYFSYNYMQNNMRKVLFVVIFSLINIVLFIFSAVKYRFENIWIIIARGSGMCLNFDCAFILVLMLRNCLTWFRATKIASYLPLDQYIVFHKMLGVVVVIFSFLHSVGHLANFGVLVIGINVPVQNNVTTPGFEYWEYLFTTKPAIGWIAGFAPLSGVIMDIILVTIAICSLNLVRRNGYFQVFYWTHMLYIPFWIFLVLHGPIFWIFFVIPAAIFIIEKILRSQFVKLARFGRTYITEVNLLSSKVTHLIISRPSNFHYRPGDYIFVQIQAIAKHEWHPFTISSAPEMPGFISLHVRSIGNWTNKLREFFDNYIDNENNDVEPRLIRVTTLASSSGQLQKKARRKVVKVPISLDGPYGTPTREIYQAEHAVLIGAGIGVTPFASVLQSIMCRFRATKRMCPNCNHKWYGVLPENIIRLQKVDFFWINRDQTSFEWFVSLLTQLEIEQAEESSFDRFLELHMYITAALRKADMKAVGLQMALELLHKKENKDLITGLRTRTQAGRPNWDEVFQRLMQQNKGRIQVFYCGNPALAKVLKTKCQKYDISFRKENF